MLDLYRDIGAEADLDDLFNDVKVSELLAKTGISEFYFYKTKSLMTRLM